MKLNPFCMCCAINKQEKKIRDFDDADRKTEYMKKVMELMANAGEDDCAPSISIDLKKCSAISGSSPWKITLPSRKNSISSC